jgi:hypothetical protein
VDFNSNTKSGVKLGRQIEQLAGIGGKLQRDDLSEDERNRLEAERSKQLLAMKLLRRYD